MCEQRLHDEERAELVLQAKWARDGYARVYESEQRLLAHLVLIKAALNDPSLGPATLWSVVRTQVNTALKDHK